MKWKTALQKTYIYTPEKTYICTPEIKQFNIEKIKLNYKQIGYTFCTNNHFYEVKKRKEKSVWVCEFHPAVQDFKD